jgi:hypothetical protein
MSNTYLFSFPKMKNRGRWDLSDSPWGNIEYCTPFIQVSMCCRTLECENLMCYYKSKVGIILYGWIEAFCLNFPYLPIFSFPKICTFFYECWLLSILNLSGLCFSCRAVRIVKTRIMILDYMCIQLVQEMNLAGKPLEKKWDLCSSAILCVIHYQHFGTT